MMISKTLTNLIFALSMIVVAIAWADCRGTGEAKKIQQQLDKAQKLREDRIRFGEEWRKQSDEDMRAISKRLHELTVELENLRNDQRRDQKTR
jgi:hypothetical protein